MLRSDNAWKYTDISATVNDCYFAVQNAWAEMDMTPASQYLSDELFESLQTKLNWMAYRKEDRWVLHKILQKNEADQIPFAD